MSDIKYAINRWVRNWNNYDLSIISQLFLNDSRVSYFSSEKEGLIKGIKALIDHHKDFGFVKGGKDTGNKLWLMNIDCEIFNETAIVKAEWVFQRKGSDQVQKGPVSLIYIIVDNEFRIAHAHFSNY
jgi:hypothetical protein